MIKNLLGIVMLSGGMLIGCNQSQQKSKDSQMENAEIVDVTHSYICPMGCENSGSDHAGVCSVCGMDMVKNKNYKGAAVNDSIAIISMDSTSMQKNSSNNKSGNNH